MVYALGLEASIRYFYVLHLLFEHFISIITMSDFCLPLLHLTWEDDLCGLDSWLALELFLDVSDIWCFLALFPSPWFPKTNSSSYVCSRFLLIWLKLLIHLIDYYVGRDRWRLKRFNLSPENYSEPICGVEEANLNLFDDFMPIFTVFDFFLPLLQLTW